MSRRLQKTLIAACAILAWINRLQAAETTEPMVVHEWGTFTALQDEHGKPLVGINVDTEPVPKFVHNLGRFILNDAVLTSSHWIHRQKAVPRNHPQVSLRLETPVIYFYPPPGKKLPITVDVDVKFRGGWLTEFYPKADVVSPVVENGEFEFTNLTQKTIGNITWKNLQIGTDQPGPETQEQVWLAPRNVAAASVTSEQGEYEKYLFYRGVARQGAPLCVVTEDQGKSLAINTVFQNFLQENQEATIKNMWLMETRANGASAFRRLDSMTAANDRKPFRRLVAPRQFSESDFDPANRGRLEEEMSAALIREGLFADEANALLSTWQQAYFKSPGLRLFYTVPRELIDFYLPLTISGENRITRVMVGRMELISDAQRELLRRLTHAPISKGRWLSRFPDDSPVLRKLLAGRTDVGALGETIPPDFQIYLELGRFRNALIANEERRTRSPNLAQFIQENELDPFRLSQSSGK